MPHPTDSRSSERLDVEYGRVAAQAVGRCTRSALEVTSVLPVPTPMLAHPGCHALVGQDDQFGCSRGPCGNDPSTPRTHAMADFPHTPMASSRCLLGGGIERRLPSLCGPAAVGHPDSLHRLAVDVATRLHFDHQCAGEDSLHVIPLPCRARSASAASGRKRCRLRLAHRLRRRLGLSGRLTGG
jgi:hypothetical protein